MVRSVTLLDIAMADDGHRASYVEILSRHFDAERLPWSAKAVFSRKPVLVTMIEDSLPKYALVALIRSLLGRRTAGVLFLPKPALELSSLRLRVKYWALRALRQLPLVQTLTILPFELEPRFSEIARGWIYDPQLWDLVDGGNRTVDPRALQLASAVRQKAAGRRVCMALGLQDRSKGFEWFVDLFAGNPALRSEVLFGFGGKVRGSMQKQLVAFESAGGFVCDRLVTEGELMALYACSDLIWCAYLPDRDQASGIFGRAVQLGIPVVVRKGSLIHRLCESEGIACIAIDHTADWQSLVVPVSAGSTDIATERARRMRQASVFRLQMALGFSG